jgi:hypothetical protein
MDLRPRNGEKDVSHGAANFSLTSKVASTVATSTTTDSTTRGGNGERELRAGASSASHNRDGEPAQAASPKALDYNHSPHSNTPQSVHAAGAAADGDDPHLHDGSASHDLDHDPNNPDSKRPRACDSCRGLKVRCIFDPDDPDAPCKRCKKAGRKCIVTAPTRKRQKKTDSRVAELEKKIDALTASLQARGSGAGTSSITTAVASSATRTSHPLSAPDSVSLDPPWGRRATNHWPLSSQERVDGTDSTVPSPVQSRASTLPNSIVEKLRSGVFTHPQRLPGQKRKLSERQESPDQQDGPELPLPPAPCYPMQGAIPPKQELDIIDRGVLTLEKANELFARYNDHMVGHLPAVVFPCGYALSDLRKQKPILFLAVMAAGSNESPNLQRQLSKELMTIFADRIFMLGRKSLELVQALMVAVIWYWPPEHFEELKFYQLIHTAAVMGIEIGLGRRSTSRRKDLDSAWREGNYKRLGSPENTTLECRRTWLACYYLASNTAVALHRPNLIRWTTFMAESVDVLRASPDAAPTDKYFCHLVWTNKIAEEIGIEFEMDDPSVVVNLADRRTQHNMRRLERQLEVLEAKVEPELMQRTFPSLLFFVLQKKIKNKK